MSADTHNDPRAQARLDWARTASGDARIGLVRASTDAGFRSYWRTTGHHGAPPASLIVMDSPPGAERSSPVLEAAA